jgi:chromosome partitioning protein
MNDRVVLANTGQVLSNKDNQTRNRGENNSKVSDSIESEDISIRRAQIINLIESGDTTDFNKLLHAVEDEDDFIRCIAAKGLGKSGNLIAIDILIKSLKDNSPALRKQAALALGKLGDTKAIPPLVGALKDKDRVVRKAAKKSIAKINRSGVKSGETGKISTEKSSETADGDDNTLSSLPDNIILDFQKETIDKIDNPKKAEDFALPVTGDQKRPESSNNDVDSLIKGLNDTDQEVRIRSIRLLRTEIHDGDMSALDSLIESLKNDKSAYIRSKAAVYLGIIKNRKAIEPLELALKDESCHVRKKAKEALGIIEEANHIKHINKLVQIKETNGIKKEFEANVREITPQQGVETKDNPLKLEASAETHIGPLKSKPHHIDDFSSLTLENNIKVKQPNELPSYGILQVNEKSYDLPSALVKLKEITYAIESDKIKLGSGDIVYLWDPNCQGIVATAIVTADLGRVLPDEEEIPFLRGIEPSKQNRVRLQIRTVLEMHITRSMLIAHARLKYLPILKISRDNPYIVMNQKDAQILDTFIYIKNNGKKGDGKLSNGFIQVSDKNSSEDSVIGDHLTHRFNQIHPKDSERDRRSTRKSPVIISTINLKGGVGKTSITLALGEFLALAYNKKVLVIDLDPQTNATVSLISEQTWLNKNEKGETLFQLFKDKLDKTSIFDINKSIINRVSNINGGIDNLSLLPSSIDLIKIQDSLPQISAGHFYIKSPVTILKGATEGVINNYDFVLIDCPPNLGIITLNGIYMSNYYLIPTIPDHLSTWGIPQITNRINEFKEETDIPIKPLGIIVSMYRTTCHLHNSIIDRLKQEATDGKGPRVFDTILPLRTKTAEAAEYDSEVHTLKQKYGGTTGYQIYDNLTQEVLKYAL